MEGNSEKCATQVYQLSNFDGEKILEGSFDHYMSQLKQLFSILDTRSIFDIEGISLLINMMSIIRENNMKLDGQFATLLTNIMVMESIAKEIDPSIQILKCAIPFLRFVEEGGKEIPKKREGLPLINNEF